MKSLFYENRTSELSPEFSQTKNLELAVTLSVNKWNGQTSLQLMLVDARVNSPAPTANSIMHVNRIPSPSRGSPPIGEEKDDWRICMSFRSLDPSAVYLNASCVRGADGSNGKSSFTFTGILTLG